jgi:hypothetical protein
MKTYLPFFMLFVLLGLLLLPGRVHAQEQALVVPAGSVVEGNVVTLERSIHIKGTVIGDVTSFSGSIVVEGNVTGDLVSYSGAIYILPGGSVDGNILALTGDVLRDTAAQVGGKTLGSTVEGAALTASASTLVSEVLASDNATLSRDIAVAIFLALTLGLGTVSAGVWPGRLRGTTRTLKLLPGRSILVGILSVVLLFGLVAIGNTLLALSLIGLPLVPLLTLFVHLPLIYGLATMALSFTSPDALIGKQLLVLLAARNLLVLVLLLGGLYLLAPLLALLSFYLLAAIGLGAAVLSRGGAFAPGVASP